MKERMSTNEGSSSYTPAEDLVAHAHVCNESLKRGHPNGGIELERLRREIAESDYNELYHQYHNGQILTLTALEKTAHHAAKEIATVIAGDRENGLTDDDLVDEIALQNILEGRVQAIRVSIRSYITTVIQYHNIKIRRQRGAMDDEDLKRQFEQIDARRRKAHNTLLESLREMTRALAQAKDEDLIRTPFIQWEVGMPISPEVQENRYVTFAESVTNNREYIRDWAIVADLDARLRSIEELVTEKK